MKKLLLLILVMSLGVSCNSGKSGSKKDTECDVNCGLPEVIVSNPLILNALSCYGKDKDKISSGGFSLVSMLPVLNVSGVIPPETSQMTFRFSKIVDPLSVMTMTAAFEDSTLLLCTYSENESATEICNDQEIITTQMTSDKTGVVLSLASGSLKVNQKYRLRISPVLKSADGQIIGCFDDILFTTSQGASSSSSSSSVASSSAPSSVSSSSSSSSAPSSVSSSSSSSSAPGGIIGSSSSVSSAPSSRSSSSARSSSSSSSSNSSDGLKVIDGPQDVYIQWSAPKERVNGELLDITEVGGYEIRYKKVENSSFKTVLIEDGYADQHTLNITTAGSYIFEISAFDKNGLYSEFVKIKAD